MNVHSQLIKAKFEQVSSDIAEAISGLFWHNTTTKKLKYYDGDAVREVVDTATTQTVTNKTINTSTINTSTINTSTLNSPTIATPVINSPSVSTPSKLEVKQGTESALTTYAATANNAQLCFATDSKVMYQVIDSALVPLGAGGGGTTLNWNNSNNSPSIEYVDGFKLGAFDNISNQELYATISVPASYRTGKPIKLRYGQFYSVSITGNVLFKTVTALIKDTTVIGIYANTKTSSNAQVAVASVAYTIKNIGDIDLTDSSGLINGVSVSPGDKLRIKLYRDNTNETSGSTADAKLLIESFEPTFS